ncbi:MAG: tetratricopeptide repeat protein [Bacteroidales bacterium]|nr:tetratricopeptide repeat protein [Bacteroidales bacterium]
MADDIQKGLSLAVADTVTVMEYNNLAKDLIAKDLGNDKAALEYLKRGIEMAQQINFIRGESELLRSAGIIYYYRKDFDLAIDRFQKALELCTQLRNSVGIARNYTNLALIYHEQSKTYNSLNCLLSALSAWRQSNDSEGMLAAYKEIIKFYQEIKNFDEAIGYTEEALVIAKESGNTAEEASLYDMLARNNINLGNTWDVAVYYDQSLKLYEELNDSLQIARIMQNMAANLYSNDLDEKLSMFKKSAAIYEKIEPANTTLYTIYNNMSRIYTTMAKKDSAEYFKQKALRKALLSKQTYTIAQAFLSSGSFYLTLKRLQEANLYFENAYTNAVSAGSQRLQTNSLFGLSKVKFSMADYDAAMLNLQKYRITKDSLSKLDNQQNVAQLEKQYQFEKEERIKNEEIRLQIETQNRSIQQQKGMVYAILAVSAITVLLLLFIFRWRNINNKANAKLTRQQEEISQGNKELQVSYNELTDYRDLLEEKVKIQTAKLQQSELQLTTLSDNLPGGCIYRKILSADGTSRISYISNTSKRWMGIAPEDIKRDINLFYQLIHADDLKEKLRMEAESIQNMTAYSCEFRVNRDGKEIWLLEAGTPHKYGDQTLMDTIAVDISDQKEIEAELIRARRQSERSDRLKSTFLANMSHEIRTPMNGIVGFLSFLEQDHITAEKRQFYIKIIRSNVEQLLQLIGDIIDISKMDTQQLSLHPTSFDLNSMMKHLEVMFQDIVSRNENRIEIILDDHAFVTPCTIHTDPVRLRQVLINLVANAVKFTSKGYIRFGYSVEKNGTELHLFVEDTGIGIPKNKQNLIFERFQQLNIDLPAKGGGAGLGLAISKNLVEMMNGHIWVESVVGSGSTFYFTLPCLSRVA